MKTLLCVVPVLLLFGMVGASNARADSYTPIFTCGQPHSGFGGCSFGPMPTIPTAADVSFPSPTSITITFDMPAGPVVYDVTLSAPDAPTDAYGWNLDEVGTGTESSDVLDIFDTNTKTLNSAVLPASVGGALPGDVIFGGGLSFEPATSATPEPASMLLIVLGAGLIFFIMRKRFATPTPRTA